ncbi:hypothetical protein VTP01DRAFT_7515 [Rhizomucor pusillus]|uniref:uncharacterized protein n=1 Tax=Rhizomucor pusillus TaxID=4840 RepID=UPI003742A7E5
MNLSPTLLTAPSDENDTLLGSIQSNEHQEESSRNHVEPTDAKGGPANCDLSEGEEAEEDVDSVSKSSTPYSKVHMTADEESQVRRSRKDNPLIRPCRCKGSMMSVHVDCLNRWPVMSPRQESFVACDLCGYKYNIHRPRRDAALGVAFAAFAAIITVVFGIMGVVSGVYALAESFVQKIAGRVKERILEVNL